MATKKKKAEKVEVKDLSNADWQRVKNIESQFNHFALQIEKLEDYMKNLKAELEEALENKPVEVDEPAIIEAEQVEE